MSKCIRSIDLCATKYIYRTHVKPIHFTTLTHKPEQRHTLKERDSNKHSHTNTDRHRHRLTHRNRHSHKQHSLTHTRDGLMHTSFCPTSCPLPNTSHRHLAASTTAFVNINNNTQVHLSLPLYQPNWEVIMR